MQSRLMALDWNFQQLYTEEAMLRGKRSSITMICLSAWSLVSCGSSDSAAHHLQSGEKHEDDKVLNLYIWADEMPTCLSIT